MSESDPNWLEDNADDAPSNGRSPESPESMFAESSSVHDREDLVVDVPQSSNYAPDRIPYGYDPMGDVYLRGQAYRRLATGNLPWWILMTGWIFLGIPSLIVIGLAIASLSWWATFPIFLAIIPLIILWRGTARQLQQRRDRSSR